MNSGKVALGILAGVAVGAVLGILFALDKGSVTRKKIIDKGDGAIDDMKDKLSDFLDGISQKFESIRDEVSNSKREEAK